MTIRCSRALSFARAIVPSFSSERTGTHTESRLLIRGNLQPKLKLLLYRRELWETRRATLASLIRKAVNGIRLSDYIEGTGAFTIFGDACQMGLEGIVAKRRDRPYKSGRSPDWIKIKNPAHPGSSGRC